MAVKDKIQAIPVQSIDVAGLAGTFASLDVNGIPEACTIIRFVNDSDTTVIISYNGSDDQEVVRANSDAILEFQTNGQPQNQRSLLAKGTQIYVRGTAGIGFFYVIGYYQDVL